MVHLFNMQLTLYKLNQLVEDFPMLLDMIDEVQIVQDGDSEKNTIVQVRLKNFSEEKEIFLTDKEK